MAVKTVFSDEMIREVFANYDLGDLKRFQPISEGAVQTNYVVQTTRAKFIFRYYENRSIESVQFECNLISYLQDRDYPCPAVFKDKRDQSVGMMRGKPFAVFAFIAGEHLQNPAKAQQKQLIQKAAELQILTRGYRPPGWRRRWNYGIAFCRDLAEQSARRINTDCAREKLAWYLETLSGLVLPRSLPKGICHCDFHFSNILWKDSQFAALIDFDDANYTYLTYDLVNLLNPFIREFDWNTWPQFEKGRDILDFHEARGIVREYLKHRPLSRIEKRHLFDVFKLSVMIDCLWYFERGGPEDFYERRKIDTLDRFGRDDFYEALFS